MNLLHHAKLRALNEKPHWIQDVVEGPNFKKGAFTKKAKAAGYKTRMFMNHVLDNPDLYDPTTKHQAQFMKNILRREE